MAINLNFICMVEFLLLLIKNNFDKLIGKDIHYLEMYNASEGFFAAQDKPG